MKNGKQLSHVCSSNALISVEYRNGCPTLDVYLILCNFDGDNSIKTDLHICNLWTGQFVSNTSL